MDFQGGGPIEIRVGIIYEVFGLLKMNWRWRLQPSWWSYVSSRKSVYWVYIMTSSNIQFKLLNWTRSGCPSIYAIEFFTFVAASLSSSRNLSFVRVFKPMTPPPHWRNASELSLNWALHIDCSRWNCCTSPVRTPVRATHVAFFWFTVEPRKALELTMQYGTSILRQRAGSHTMSSRGSTSAAMTTNFAFFFSTRCVTWFRPNWV